VTMFKILQYLTSLLGVLHHY